MLMRNDAAEPGEIVLTNVTVELALAEKAEGIPGLTIFADGDQADAEEALVSIIESAFKVNDVLASVRVVDACSTSPDGCCTGDCPFEEDENDFEDGDDANDEDEDAPPADDSILLVLTPAEAAAVRILTGKVSSWPGDKFTDAVGNVRNAFNDYLGQNPFELCFNAVNSELTLRDDEAFDAIAGMFERGMVTSGTVSAPIHITAHGTPADAGRVM